MVIPERALTVCALLRRRSWVATNKEASLHKFWIEGVRDYLQHAKKLLDEYKDILPSEGVSSLQQAAAGELGEELPSRLRGSP